MKKIVALLLSCLTGVSIMAFSGCSENPLPEPTPGVLDQSFDLGGMVVGEGTGEAVKFNMRNLMQSEYEEYGVLPTAETAYVVTATVLPEDAGNKKIDWSISFVDPSSSWAKGKALEDYVKASFSDTQVTLTCLGAFGSQIKVTATSAADPSISSSFTLDYAQKVESAAVRFGYLNLNLGGVTDIVYELSRSVPGPGGEAGVSVTKTNVYTIADEFHYELTIEDCYRDGVYRYLALNNFMIDDMPLSSMIGVPLDLTDGFGPGTEIYFDYTHDMQYWSYLDYTIPVGQRYNFSSMSYESIVDALENVSSPWMYTVQLKITGEYSSYTYTSDLKFAGFINSTPVESISFDYTNVVL